MIDLERLVIKKGDLVKLANSPVIGLDPVPFLVDKVEILNLIPMVYPESGLPIEAAKLIVVQKNTELTLAEKNKAVLEEILELIYPGKWDITPGRKYGYSDNNTHHVLVIHFPEIVIKNSRANEHVIRDLYVSVSLNRNYRVNNTYMYGMRTTRTEAEIGSRYSHSHLSTSGRYPSWSSFCLGSGIINESLLNARNVDPSSNKLFYEILFEALDTYVAWESLEGGPYNRMQYIGTNRSSYHSIHNWAYNGIPRNFIKAIKDKNFIIPIDYNLESRVVLTRRSIIDINKQTFKDTLREFFLSNIEYMRKHFSDNELNKILVSEMDRSQRFLELSGLELVNLINNKEGKEEEKKETDEYAVSEGPGSGLIFKGEEIIHKTLDKKTESKINTTFITINNSLVNILINHFTTKFYEELFKREEKFISELTSDTN